MPYTPHTAKEVQQMLEVIGVENEEAIFDSVPQPLRPKAFEVPEGIDEFSAFEYFKSVAQKNSTHYLSFLGGGYYDHIIPSAVDALSSRAEFYTAYTPYQAEASQGTLQSLYEYQSLMCRLFNMEVSNASLYDGGTALAEAALMACRITHRNKIIVDKGINPEYIKIIQTYLTFRDIACVIIDYQGDGTDIAKSVEHIDDQTAGYILQNPNFLGSVQDFSPIIDKLHRHKALAIGSFYPISLGLLKTPGEMDIDIACGDGQSLGNYINFAGPSFGIITTKQAYIRGVPGRIIGKTTDKNGKEMFALTLQAREQHIRRHRATSNICTNQNLLALRASIFLSLIGKAGLTSLAHTIYHKSEYLKKSIEPYSRCPIIYTPILPLMSLLSLHLLRQ